MNVSYERAAELLDLGDLAAAEAAIERLRETSPADPKTLFAQGRLLFMTQRYDDAAAAFEAASHAAPGDREYALAWTAALRATTTLRGRGQARDILLALLERYPDDSRVLRDAAQCCLEAGPHEKALDLYRRAAATSADASVHYGLSEAYAALGDRRDALAALRTAARLDPERYGAMLAEVDIVEPAAGATRARPKRARYPDSHLIQSDLKETIMRHLLADLEAPKFVTAQTSFFTMGSCFAWNIAQALLKLGYATSCMPLSEEINTSFANRYFVDWLQDKPLDPLLAERIAGMLPAGFSKPGVLEKLRSADVFILTLGVGAAFFDRETGAFIMPRPTSLNLRTLAEKYEFRTTSVAENVENLDYVVDFVRRLNPGLRIVLTVSPVPMHMTFEFNSAVIADCLSKSTMRIAAHEVMKAQKAKGSELYYFPSFEVFRWLGGHIAEPVYGNDDGAAWHVSEEIVALVVECFIEKLADPAQMPVPGEVAQAGSPIALRSLHSTAMIDRAVPTYVYGSGRMGQELVAAMGDSSTWNFKGFIDSFKSGSCRGHQVLDLVQLRAAYQPGEQIVIASGSVAEIAQKLAEAGIMEASDANPWWRSLALTTS